MAIERLVIRADGVAKGNPGPAAIGATIKDEQGRPVACISQRIGWATNNQAEYRAIIAALEKAIELGAREVSVSLDSQLIVRQVSGEYRVKAAGLKPLYQQLKQLRSQLESFAITHIPREENTEADKLANMALRI